MNALVASATVLVVEDDPLFRVLLCHMVEALGFQASAQADGSEAVTTCRSIQPDLVLMDIMMPELSGIEAARIIRSERDVPVVLASGSSLEEYKDLAMAAGAAGFLRKPFTLEDLRQVLDRLLKPESFRASAL